MIVSLKDTSIGPAEKVGRNRSVNLTDRELEVMTLAANGWTDVEISESLGVAKDTVSTFWRRILAKFNAASRTEAVAKHINWIANARVEDVEKRLQAVHKECSEKEKELELCKQQLLLRQAVADAERQLILNQECYQVVFDSLLASALSLTNSTFGFLAEVRYEGSQPYLRTFTLTNISWDDETKDLFEKNKANGFEFKNLKTLFGQVLTTKRMVVSNDPKNDRRSGGLPAGHPELSNFLGIPLMSGESMVGMLGIANRPGSYSIADAEYLQPFLYGVVTVLTRYKLEQQNKALESVGREKDALTHIVADTLNVGYLLFDSNEIILSVNDKFCSMFAVEKESIVGQPGPAFFDRVRNNVLNADEMWRTAYEFISSDLDLMLTTLKMKDGRIIERELQRVPSNESGVAYFITYRDVTRQFEREKSSREEQLRADRGQFIANVSHELKTPLNGIVLSAQLLLDQIHAGKSRDRLISIMNCTRQLEDKIDTILSLTERQNNSESTELESVDLKNLFSSVYERWEAKAVEKNLDLIVRGPIGILPMVSTNLVAFNQIISCLMDNAIRFTQVGGIRLTWKAVQHGEALSLRIVIIDTGVGMNSDLMEHCFDAFKQSDSSHQRVNGGLGLGLTLALNNIRNLGGQLQVRSREGVGTAFRMKVDLQMAGLDKFDECLEFGAVTQRKLNVLVVEDDPISRMLLCEMVSAMGVNVFEAENGLRAISIYEDECIDLIFMDVQMPICDGIEATREIRLYEQRHQLNPIPIHVVTASARPEQIKILKDAGVDGLIQKPVAKMAVQDVINAVCKTILGQ